jgi:hypothetical protein
MCVLTKDSGMAEEGTFMNHAHGQEDREGLCAPIYLIAKYVANGGICPFCLHGY